MTSPAEMTFSEFSLKRDVCTLRRRLGKGIKNEDSQLIEKVKLPSVFNFAIPGRMVINFLPPFYIGYLENFLTQKLCRFKTIVGGKNELISPLPQGEREHPLLFPLP